MEWCQFIFFNEQNIQNYVEHSKSPDAVFFFITDFAVIFPFEFRYFAHDLSRYCFECFNIFFAFLENKLKNQCQSKYRC